MFIWKLYTFVLLYSVHLICTCESFSTPSGGETFLTVPNDLEYLASTGMLVRPHQNLYVLGTVHIGSKSAQDAELLINTIKPSSVVVEVPPSRLKRIQQKFYSENPQKKIIENNHIKQMDLIGAIGALPSLASAGFQKGGISGLCFSTVIVWSSLLKRSMTSNEEIKELPRRNEFEAAIYATERLGAKIIPADAEFDDLIQSVANSMDLIQWIQLGVAITGEFIGLLPTDPIRREKGEAIDDWEIRRRDINVARASRKHGDTMAPQLSKVLVEQRDKEFARICLNQLDINREGTETVVCLIGLVHVDGVVSSLKNSKKLLTANET